MKTDEEIIQTLKNHIEAEDCVTCESFGKCNEFLLTKNTLDLINRLQTEIKRLKAEAIREFADRVKMEFYYEFDELIPSIMAEKIDNIVKEMGG